jgi:hypothetical protein
VSRVELRLVILSFAFDASTKGNLARSRCATATSCPETVVMPLEMQIFFLIEQNCKFRSDPLAITLKSR